MGDRNADGARRETEGERGREGKVIGFPTPPGETPTLPHRKKKGGKWREEGANRRSKAFAMAANTCDSVTPPPFPGVCFAQGALKELGVK